MTITRKDVAEKISAYLHHQITLAELVNWAENAMMEADFEEDDLATIRNALSRLGLADIREFGLLWEDCETILRELGFTIRLEIVAA